MSRDLKRRVKLVAVVVTHNRLEKLQTTVTRLLASNADELAAVVVVDCASTDGTADWLARRTDRRVVTLHCRRNIGGAGGFARGLRVAMDDLHADWAVVMDDDARPLPGALAAFHARRRSGVEAIAAAVYLPDGAICEMNRPSRNPFWDFRCFLRTVLSGRDGFHIAPARFLGDPCEVDVASFVGLFLSRRAIEMAGYPDPRLFLYGDDCLFTLGLRRAGGCIEFDPAVRFEHDLTTFANPRAAFRPLWKAYYYHRNLLLFYRSAAGVLFWPALLVVLPRWLLGHWFRASSAVGQRLFLRSVRDGIRRDLSLPHWQLLKMSGPEPVDTCTATAPRSDRPFAKGQGNSELAQPTTHRD